MRSGRASARRRQSCRVTELIMPDVVMLVLGCGFFAAAAAYVYACDRL